MGKETKWYIKILIFLLIVVFSPVIICFLLLAGIILLKEWLKTPLYKKQYQQSAYYQDLKIPYRRFILQASSYLFYNAARKQHISMELIHQDNNNLDYVIYKEAIYLFPWFDQMSYNDEIHQWEVDVDGHWFPFEEEMDKQIVLLNDNHLNLPIYLLLREGELILGAIFVESADEIKDGDYAKKLLPPCVKIGENYLSALVGKPTEVY